MKKTLSIALLCIMAVSLFAGCSNATQYAAQPTIAADLAQPATNAVTATHLLYQAPASIVRSITQEEEVLQLLLSSVTDRNINLSRKNHELLLKHLLSADLIKTYSWGDRFYWELDNEYTLFITGERKLELRRNGWIMEITPYTTIDYDGYSSRYVFDDSTWVSNEKGVSRWIFGEEEQFLIPMSYPTFLGYNYQFMKATQAVLFLGDGTTLATLATNGLYTELATDFAHSYRTYCYSLFYININSELVHVNLVDMSSEIIADNVYELGGSDWLWYCSMGEIELVPFIIDWDEEILEVKIDW